MTKLRVWITGEPTARREEISALPATRASVCGGRFQGFRCSIRATRIVSV
jgi:hypothetical protein